MECLQNINTLNVPLKLIITNKKAGYLYPAFLLTLKLSNSNVMIISVLVSHYKNRESLFGTNTRIWLVKSSIER